MKSLCKLILVAVMIIQGSSVLAGTGLVEDFNDNTLTKWTGSGYYQLTEANQELKVVVNKRNNSWASFYWSFLATMVDMSENPYVTIKVKSDVDMNFNFSVWDNYSQYAYPVIGDWQGAEIVASDDYQTYCFNFTGIPDVNLANIFRLNFVCNPGSPVAEGTVYIDDIHIGSAAVLTPTITNVPTQQHVINAGPRTIPFRGVSDGAGATNPITITAVSSDTNLIPDPVVDYTSPASTGYFVYTPVADQTGTATIIVNVAAVGADANAVMTFDVEVEKNFAPRIAAIDNQNAKAGRHHSLELTDIDDGNPNARQSITVTAQSSNPTLIPDPNVEYNSDDFTATLTYTPTLGQTGLAAITVTVQDDGAAVAGGVDTTQVVFDVNVYELLNNPPTIYEVGDVSVLQDDGEQIIVLTGISDGDDDANQTVSILAASSDTNLIPTPAIVYTSPNQTAELRFTPAAGQIGTASITLTVSDNGGLPNNNGNESIETSLDIQVRVRPITGFEDDFEDGIIDPTWLETGEGAHTCTEEGGALKIVVDKVPTGNKWAGLWYAIPDELDINENPYISITMKTDNPTNMLIFLWDYQDHYNTAGTVTHSVGTNYVEYYFDFTGKTLQGDGQEVDISRLKALLFNFDPGGLPLYQGTFWFDDLRVGDLAHVPFVMPNCTIDPAPDCAVAENSTEQNVYLTGITDGNDGTNPVGLNIQSSNTSLIPTPGAGAVVNGCATLTYTPNPDTTGSSTITVTASADGSNNKQITFNIDIVAVEVGSAIDVSLDLTTTYQTIDGFGAFLGWGPDLLIPHVIDIGMSMPRFGIIGTELEHSNDNSDPNIIDFDNINYSALNMSFMKHLKEQAGCVDKIILTYWSPPAWMKKNKCLSADSWATDNILLPHFYEEYAEDVIALIKAVKKKTGFDVYALSLQNEPQFNEPYDSCVILWDQYAEMLRVIGPILEAEGITTKLFFPEALLAQGRIDDYIHTLNADPIARQYMDIVAVHNYDSDGINVGGPGAAGWADIWSWAQETPAKPTWMTETSGHANNWNGALTLAGNIYNALYYGNASAWVFWSFAVSSGSDVFGLIVNNEPTSRYYVSKQYYKYVRPDAVRVSAVSAHSDILALAFHHETDGKVAVVLTNRGSAPRVVDVTGVDLPKTYESYTTSEYRNFERGPDVVNGLVLIPPSSLTTLYGSTPPPAKATSPNPANASKDITTTPTLVWSAGYSADSHNVYFGTTPVPTFIDNRTSPSYNPGSLENDTTYYWRIDEKNVGGTTTGDPWRFRTQAVGPVEGYDFADFSDFADEFDRTDCNAVNAYCNGADRDEDGFVDLLDVTMWTQQWLLGF